MKTLGWGSLGYVGAAAGLALVVGGVVVLALGASPTKAQTADDAEQELSQKQERASLNREFDGQIAIAERRIASARRRLKEDDLPTAIVELEEAIRSLDDIDSLAEEFATWNTVVGNEALIESRSDRIQPIYQTIYLELGRARAKTNSQQAYSRALEDLNAGLERGERSDLAGQLRQEIARVEALIDKLERKIDFRLVTRQVMPPGGMSRITVERDGTVMVDTVGIDKDGIELVNVLESVQPGTIRWEAYRHRGKATHEELRALDDALRKADVSFLRIPRKMLPRRVRTEGGATITSPAGPAKDYDLWVSSEEPLLATETANGGDWDDLGNHGMDVVKLQGHRRFYGDAEARIGPVMEALDRIQARIVPAKVHAWIQDMRPLED